MIPFSPRRRVSVRQCLTDALSDSGFVAAGATASYLTPDIQLTMSTFVFLRKPAHRVGQRVFLNR